ncbi:MAG: nucleotidyl transferase AbiEii/AbiGii toxin family protein [Planctomycetes bacterium]|nr:nucleotidyl transferase AbiEii/AbiGii toxin family protein [Planctomycetota bacterium]
MIPQDHITQWRTNAPWVSDHQVEQDLVISRALVALYSHPTIAELVAFRGGTALYKLHLRPAARYSEDIDLVQTSSMSIGPLLDAVHEVLDPWLGSPQWKQGEDMVTLAYRFTSEALPAVPLRLKVEINTREHFTLHGYEHRKFEVASRWFRGATTIRTYSLDELLGTKLRALYQRRKARDLFDLVMALRSGQCSAERIVDSFRHYTGAASTRVTRAMFERNLTGKQSHPLFLADLRPLLAAGDDWDADAAMEQVRTTLITLLPGEPWQGA